MQLSVLIHAILSTIFTKRLRHKSTVPSGFLVLATNNRWVEPSWICTHFFSKLLSCTHFKYLRNVSPLCSTISTFFFFHVTGARFSSNFFLKVNLLYTFSFECRIHLRHCPRGIKQGFEESFFGLIETLSIAYAEMLYDAIRWSSIVTCTLTATTDCIPRMWVCVNTNWLGQAGTWGRCSVPPDGKCTDSRCVRSSSHSPPRIARLG